MNIFQFISVQVLHKRIRGGGRVKVAADMLTRGGEGGQNFGKSAYVILEQSLTCLLEILSGVLKRSHCTTSLQPGVVRDPE